MPKGTVAEKKIEPDFKYDLKSIVSKQKMLKIALQKCSLDNTVVYAYHIFSDFVAVKHKGQIYEVGSFI